MTITPGQVVVVRRLLGWTQKGLAVRARLSQGAIANIEKGRRPAGAEFTQACVALRSQSAVSNR
jgi:transcriptional regulator with XRE-family HTH domain